MNGIANTNSQLVNRQRLIVECSATKGTGMSPLYLQRSGAIVEKKEKDCKSKKTGEKQDLLGRTRLLHP